MRVPRDNATFVVAGNTSVIQRKRRRLGMIGDPGTSPHIPPCIPDEGIGHRALLLSLQKFSGLGGRSEPLVVMSRSWLLQVNISSVDLSVSCGSVFFIHTRLEYKVQFANRRFIIVSLPWVEWGPQIYSPSPLLLCRLAAVVDEIPCTHIDIQRQDVWSRIVSNGIYQRLRHQNQVER